MTTNIIWRRVPSGERSPHYAEHVTGAVPGLGVAFHAVRAYEFLQVRDGREEFSIPDIGFTLYGSDSDFATACRYAWNQSLAELQSMAEEIEAARKAKHKAARVRRTLHGLAWAAYRYGTRRPVSLSRVWESRHGNA